MHRGEDAEFYLKKGYDVVGFEADPRLIAHCKERFKDVIATGRMRLVEGAIAPSHFGNEVTFFQNQKETVWGTIDPARAALNARLGGDSDVIAVSRVDISEAFGGFGIPYYLKVDIERADKYVLEGLCTTADRPQYISIESDKDDISAVEAELQLLQELGYSKFKAVQQQSIPGTTIATKALDGREFLYTFPRSASGPFGDDIPQPWLTAEAVLHDYRSIFHRYRLFGDDSPLLKAPRHVRLGAEVLHKLRTGYEGPLPGWCDTHAAL